MNRIVPVALLVFALSAGICNTVTIRPSANLHGATPIVNRDSGSQSYRELLNIQISSFRGAGQTSYFMAAVAIDASGRHLPSTNTLDGFKRAALSIIGDPIFSSGRLIMNEDFGIAMLTVEYDQSRVSWTDAKADSIRIADFYTQIFNLTFQTNSSSYGSGTPPPTLYFYYNPIPNPQNSTYYLSWAKSMINRTLEELPADGLAGTFNYQYLRNLGSQDYSLEIFFGYFLNSTGCLSTEYYFGRVLNQYTDGQHSLSILDVLNTSSLTSKYGPISITCNPVRPYYSYFGVGVRTCYYFGGVNSSPSSIYTLMNSSDPNMGDGFNLLLNADTPINTLILAFNTVTSPTLFEAIDALMPAISLAMFVAPLALAAALAITRKAKKGSGAAQAAGPMDQESAP